MSRAKGHSAVAAAAYRSGSKLVDERTGEVFDYTRKGGVTSAEIVTPEGVPIPERSALWNGAEAAENRKDSRVAREWLAALPHELDEVDRKALAHEMAKTIADRYGVPVDVCIHAPDKGGDDRNYHVHMLAATRVIEQDGSLGKKSVIELANKDRKKEGIKGTSQGDITELRAQWESLTNRALERAGVTARIDHRSYAEQGIGLTPTKHVGRDATAMERRGMEADRIDIHNADRKKQAEEITARPEIIIEKITAKQTVFTKRDIAQELNRYIDDADKFQELLVKLEQSPLLVEMEPEKDQSPAKFSSREMVVYDAGKGKYLSKSAQEPKELSQQQRNSNLLHQEKGESLQQGLTPRMEEIRAQAAERLKARQPTQAELDRQERFAATVEKLRARNGNQDMQTEQTRPNQKEETHKEFLERQDEERQRLAERQAQNLPNENAQGAILQERQQEEQQRIREQQEDQQQRVREQVEGQQQQVRDDAASRRESQEQARRQAQIMADMQAAQRHAARVDASEPNTRVTRKDISHLNESIKTGGLNDMAAQEWRGGIGVKSEKDLAIDSQILSSKIETEIMLKEYYTPANSIKQVREMMQGREARDQLQERLDKALQDNDGLRQENKELKDRIEALERRLESQAEARQTSEQKDNQAQGKHQEQQHTHDAAEKHQDKQQTEQQIKQKELMSERANVHERAHEEKVIKAEQEHKPAQIEAERSASSQRMLEMRQRAMALQAEKQYETASEQQRGQEMEQ